MNLTLEDAARETVDAIKQLQTDWGGNLTDSVQRLIRSKHELLRLLRPAPDGTDPVCPVCSSYAHREDIAETGMCSDCGEEEVV